MGSECDLLNEHSERDWHAEAQAVTFCHGLVNKEAEMHKSAHINVIGSILVGVAMLMGAPAWAADSNASPTVSLTQTVHFLDAKGQDRVVGPGEFRVEAAGKSGLKLTPADGKEPIVIEGQDGSIKAPVALSVPVNENEHHLVLLLPKGNVVEVVGSPSGIRSRGPIGYGYPYWFWPLMKPKPNVQPSKPPTGGTTKPTPNSGPIQ